MVAPREPQGGPESRRARDRGADFRQHPFRPDLGPGFAPSIPTMSGLRARGAGGKRESIPPQCGGLGGRAGGIRTRRRPLGYAVASGKGGSVGVPPTAKREVRRNGERVGWALKNVVPKEGVEPSRPLGPQDFESCASASSATSARGGRF